MPFKFHGFHSARPKLKTCVPFFLSEDETRTVEDATLRHVKASKNKTISPVLPLYAREIATVATVSFSVQIRVLCCIITILQLLAFSLGTRGMLLAGRSRDLIPIR
jgi:hypothetical protein